MTVIGRDRTGLVESLAAIVAEHGGNWLESRMCRLGGEFAGILRVHVPEEKRVALLTALKGLAAQGLNVVASADAGDSIRSPGKLTRLDIVGQDRPGIVREITRELAGQGVNVEELTSECVSAAMSGEAMFRARVRLHLPPGCNVEALRGSLEKIAADLMVDVSFADVESGKGD
jgi:glycine cleavage system regulatory protein